VRKRVGLVSPSSFFCSGRPTHPNPIIEHELKYQNQKAFGPYQPIYHFIPPFLPDGPVTNTWTSLKKSGVEVTHEQLSLYIDNFAKEGDINACYEIFYRFSEENEEGVGPSQENYKVLVKTLLKCDWHDYAVTMLEEMRRENVPRDLDLYNSLLGYFVRNERYAHSVYVRQLMLLDKIPGDSETSDYVHRVRVALEREVFDPFSLSIE